MTGCKVKIAALCPCMSIMQSGCAGTAAAIGADIFYESIDLASNLLNEGATWLNNRALVIENRIQSVQKEDESTEEEKKIPLEIASYAMAKS